MTEAGDERRFVVPEGARNVRLDGFLRGQMELSWGDARALVERGKVFVNEVRAQASDMKLAASAVVVVRPRARRVSASERGALGIDASSIAYVDPHVVVVRKPAGISTVPFDERETDTLDERVRHWLVRNKGQATHASLGVVHRIDKDTSGLLVFARTFAAKKVLSNAFRAHAIERRYVALVHGDLAGERRIESVILADRGDGIRGSAKGRVGQGGQHAVTNVWSLARVQLPSASSVGVTAVACQLETGRTHQIRVHLSEAGHPLLGEHVYDRDFRRAGRVVVDAPRLMLHAAVLGFDHPITNKPLRFCEPVPEDMRAVIARLSNGSCNVAALQEQLFEERRPTPSARRR